MKGDNIMNKEFEKICKMSQKELKKYVVDQLKKSNKNVISEDGFVYADGDFPVLLVAHLDTVHEKLPTSILYDLQTNTVSSPDGIGGDDRCGVYMILKIIKKYNCSVLFCEDEEKGLIGATKFTKAAFAKDLDFNYIIEFDRKGKNDAVFYNCDNDEFEDFITAEYFEKSYGSFSDISAVAPFIGRAAVNLSCGYYNAHTTKEYVNLTEMERNIIYACEILERTTEDDVFDYVEAKRNYYSGTNANYNSSSYYCYGDYDYDEPYDTYGYYIIEYADDRGDPQWYDTFAASKEEAVGKFLMENPMMCYMDILDMCVDYGMYMQ